MRKEFLAISFLRLVCLLFLFTNCKIRSIKINRNSDLANILLKKKTKAPPYKVDNEFREIYKSFLDDAKKYDVHIQQHSVDKLRQIIWVDKLSATEEKGVLASCNRYQVKQNRLKGFTLEKESIKWMTIEVLRKDTRIFVGDSPKRLWELIYHELFHCLLNKGHLPQFDAEGNEINGIMSPILSMHSRRAEKSWNDLVEEMFSEKFLELVEDVN